MEELELGLDIKPKKIKSKVISIKILNNVQLPKDLLKYTESKDNLRVYNKGEIIENVHEKYETRMSKYPQYIQVFKGEL